MSAAEAVVDCVEMRLFSRWHVFLISSLIGWPQAACEIKTPGK